MKKTDICRNCKTWKEYEKEWLKETKEKWKPTNEGMEANGWLSIFCDTECPYKLERLMAEDG